MILKQLGCFLVIRWYGGLYGIKLYKISRY